jgi:hypothetical protein
MSKQTAIIWFNQQLVERQNGNGDRRSWSEILREALVMEREQIETAYQAGDGDAYNLKETKTWAEQYYNETYGGQDE